MWQQNNYKRIGKQLKTRKKNKIQHNANIEERNNKLMLQQNKHKRNKLMAKFNKIIATAITQTINMLM